MPAREPPPLTAVRVVTPFAVTPDTYTYTYTISGRSSGSQATFAGTVDVIAMPGQSGRALS